MNIDKIGQKGIEAYVQKTQSDGERVLPPSAREVARPEKDDVSISETAKELQEAQKAVRSAPDIREERVAAIKKQIQDGTYQVHAEAVVEKLLSVLKS